LLQKWKQTCSPKYRSLIPIALTLLQQIILRRNHFGNSSFFGFGVSGATITSMLLEGLFAALPTPFYPDERLYRRKLEANLARYSRTQLAGLVVLGSTGEASHLTDRESFDLLATTAEGTGNDKQLIAGLGRESLKANLELAEEAGRLGFDAVLARTPVYYRHQMSPLALRNYFGALADRSPLPVILYHIPQSVPCEFPVELVRDLAQHPNIIGLKDSSGDLDRLAAIVAATKDSPKRSVTVTPHFTAIPARQLKAQSSELIAPEALLGGANLNVSTLKTRTREVGFAVVTGAAHQFLPSLVAGATGAVLGFASFAPEACQEIYLAWRDHDNALAESRQKRIVAANQRILGELGISGIKYACDYNGFYGGHARLPLLPLTAAEKKEVEALLAGIRS